MKVRKCFNYTTKDSKYSGYLFNVSLDSAKGCLETCMIILHLDKNAYNLKDVKYSFTNIPRG